MFSVHLSRSVRIVVPSANRRLLHTTPSLLTGKDHQLSQGHTTDTSNSNRDPQSQAAQSGMASKSSNNPHDVAAKQPGMKASRDGGSGNKEKVGFAEQVGSASADNHGQGDGVSEMTGTEEAAPPGLLGTVKSWIGMGTSTDDVKQNQGGGRGVTGTGAVSSSKKGFHTSAIAHGYGDSATTGKQPEGSNKPRDSVHGEQNPHLKHKEGGEADKGKGNAGENPSLPSHRPESSNEGSKK